MAANTVGTDDGRTPADDPYRAVAEHLPDAAVVLSDPDLEDDGCGFGPLHTETVTDADGFGLSCMRERLQAVGGQLTPRTAPGAGTCIEARAASHAPP